MTGRTPAPAELAAGIAAGETRALARAISLVENGHPSARELVRLLYDRTGNARIVGITGAPGVGKSSLISALVGRVREDGLKVGVISIDPTSPFTGGALLGDRIRLSEHFLDPGVFIRSMGTRGHPGGLAEATLQAVLILDAAGMDVVFVETVGAGQNEIGVATAADTIVLVLMPGSGDAVQALKAGIMEIPDVIAINKADQPLASALRTDVRQMLALGGGPTPAIALTEAPSGKGVPELWAAIEAHRASLEAEGGLEERRARNLAAEVHAIASARARRHLENAVSDDKELRRLLDDVRRRKLDPLTAVHEILGKVFHIDDEDDADAR
ncbi:MAG TPA: methylmalonyl Co-A mutase-associated GTPase MeaB [Gaiellaceae bacterium]|jgi:LAO/AO transport system kinase|nr:methylmalonyl Co-A mutase-associated GTPase MeaB [Gaiellaceae bacterium]